VSVKSITDVVQPVTAFFEIEREAHDGRTTENYLKWLSETINFFPNIIVLHDKSVNSEFISKHENATFISCKINELPLYSELHKIQKISSLPIGLQSSDLVYKCPDYGIIVNSKFHFLGIATQYSELDYFMWVDAGYSRFSSLRVATSPSQFINLGQFESLFQINVKGLFRNLLIYRSKSIQKICQVGSSTRILCGISFLLAREMIPRAESTLASLHSSWLNEEKWDTEQVAIFHVMTQLNPTLVFEFNSKYDSMLEYFQKRHMRAFNILASKVLLSRISS
jgi:hypothetical protein